MCAYPHVWLDATYLKRREGSRMGSVGRGGRHQGNDGW